MPHPIAYLSFDGNCKEAMYYYEQVLGGKITVMMSGAESPMAAMIPPESAHRILHARLELPDGGLLFAGDSPQQLPYEGIKGVSFTLNYDTSEEASKIFNALSEGGQITMPVQAAFWAKSWGMLVDKYGTPWIINGEPLPI
jgi:PhnB protein